MADEPLYDQAVLESISTAVQFTNKFLLGMIGDDLNAEYTDMFEIIKQGSAQAVARVDQAESTIVTAVENAKIGVDAVGVKVDGLTNYVQQTIHPLLTDIQETVEGNTEQLTYISRMVEEIPEKTATLVSASINEGMEAVANQIQLFRLLVESIVNNQTAELKAAISDGASLMASAIKAGFADQTLQLTAFKTDLTKSVTDGFKKETDALSAIRETLETELRSIAESEDLYRDAMILFVTEFWASFEAMQIRLRQVDYDTFAAARVEGEELTVKLPDKPVEPPVISGGDDTDYVGQYVREIDAASAEEIT